MILGLTATWEVTEASETLMACIDTGRQAMGWNDQEFADRLGVAPSRVAAMRSGLDAGPGFLRFAALPLAFWIGFLKAWGVRFGFRVIDDPEMDKLIAWLNFHMVRSLKHDMARMYSPEQIAALDAEESKRLA